MTTWESVQAYKCPDCGKLVQDMDDACNHVCDYKKASNEIVKDLELLPQIERMRAELKSIPFYKLSKRRHLVNEILVLENRRLANMGISR